MLTSEIYTLAYYQSVAREAVAAGAHMIGIKDMAGLLRPLEAGYSNYTVCKYFTWYLYAHSICIVYMFYNYGTI